MNYELQLILEQCSKYNKMRRDARKNKLGELERSYIRGMHHEWLDSLRAYNTKHNQGWVHSV